MDTVWLLYLGKLIRSTLFVCNLESIRFMVSVNYRILILYVNLRIYLSVCGMNGENIRILCTSVLCNKCKKFYIDITLSIIHGDDFSVIVTVCRGPGALGIYSTHGTPNYTWMKVHTFQNPEL